MYKTFYGRPNGNSEWRTNEEDGLEKIDLEQNTNHRIKTVLDKAKSFLSTKMEKGMTPIKKMQEKPKQKDAFLTDVDAQLEMPMEMIDEPSNNMMLRDVLQLEEDSLAELRRMIQTTSKRLSGYGKQTKMLRQQVDECMGKSIRRPRTSAIDSRNNGRRKLY